MFFSLDAADGFLLSGGAALVAQGMTHRATQDLDLFTAPGRGDVRVACQALEAAVADRDWTSRRVRDGNSFVRLVIAGIPQAGPFATADSVVVDLAMDAAPQRPATMSIVGPTLAPDDLAARKVIALFDRAEARDFADVHTLAATFAPERLLALAAETDPGFDRAIFAEMLASLARFADDEIPALPADVPRLRRFYADWATILTRTIPGTS
ncbi:MAG: nucleotidyl transferase AbiEii/AbiGii toxin family protein [Kineosporiaceae bacterium]